MAALNKTICRDLNMIGENDLDVILRAHRDAKRRGIPIQHYIDQIPPAKLKAFTPEQLDLLYSGDPKQVMSNSLSLTNPLVMLETVEILLGKFKMCEEHGQLFVYEIKDEKNKVLRPLYEGEPEKVLIRYMSCKWLEITGEPLSPTLANSLYRLWFNHVQLIKRPDPMGRPDTDTWCLHRSSITPDATIAYNSWKAILNRMDDPDAFAAWVAGVYLGSYKGRQILWLYGPHGEDGKSTISKIIGQNLFGPSCAAISNASLSSSEKRFIASYFEEAELVCYPDASNRRCLMSEAFKSIASAGTDPILIERKGKQAYTALLKARLWVSSNFSPEITGDNFMTSRLLMITISKMVDEKPDPKVIQRLEAELPGFLAYAISAYHERCLDNYRIETNTESVTAVKNLSDDFYDDFEIIFSSHWQQADHSCRVDGARLRDTLRREGLTGNVEAKRFTEWMLQYKGVVKRKLSNENGRIFYYGLRDVHAVADSHQQSNAFADFSE